MSSFEGSRRGLIAAALAVVAVGSLSTAAWSRVPWTKRADPAGADTPGTAFAAVRTSRKIVALTFDDGPDPRYTPRVLALLARHGARATFFMTGAQASAHPDLARRAAAAGEVANHTFDHPRLWLLPINEAVAQIERADQALASVVGRDGLAAWLRPPFGRVSATLRLAAERTGHSLVLWSASIDPFRLLPPDEAVRRVLARVAAGGIILAHDGCPPTDDAQACDEARQQSLTLLDRVLSELTARGFRMGTVSELIRGA